MIHFIRFKVLLFFYILHFFTIFTIYGQTKKEIVLVIGAIINKTTKNDYDQLNLVLHKTLKSYPLFPVTILDPSILVDSVPDDSVILRAHNLNASYIIWGSIDTSDNDLAVTLKIFDMSQASSAHIGMMINGNEKTEEIADLLRSKLLMWLRRMTMVHLIISTTPEAATVLLDSKEIGSTPFEGMIQPGTFSLELTKKSFNSIKIPVSFISGNTYHYDITLGKSDSAYFENTRCQKAFSCIIALPGAGFGAHYFQERSMREYRSALPPSDLTNLYRKAVSWNVARNTFMGYCRCGNLRYVSKNDSISGFVSDVN